MLFDNAKEYLKKNPRMIVTLEEITEKLRSIKFVKITKVVRQSKKFKIKKKANED